MYYLSKDFVFDAAHTLERVLDAESSRRIHGHSYWAEVTLCGPLDPVTGMVIDLGAFESILKEVRDTLDHHYLDDIADLGPSTIENLSAWIWKKLQPKLPLLYKVTVSRKSSGDSCDYYGPKGKGA
jgi:6-pyruvoyltetrahydropterin/6-carboxytetrahydropterin synthase